MFLFVLSLGLSQLGSLLDEACKGKRNKNAWSRRRPAGWEPGGGLARLDRKPNWPASPPSSLEGLGQGGLVKQRSLTCWQSEPQRLVKRRCHGPCSPSAEEGCPCRLLIGLRSNGSHLPRLNVRDGNRPLSTLLGSQAGVERTDQSLQWSRPARNLKTTRVSEWNIDHSMIAAAKHPPQEERVTGSPSDREDLARRISADNLVNVNAVATTPCSSCCKSVGGVV